MRDASFSLALKSGGCPSCERADGALFPDFNAWPWSLFCLDIEEEVMINCTENVGTVGLGSLLCHGDSAPNDRAGKKKKKAEVESESKN